MHAGNVRNFPLRQPPCCATVFAVMARELEPNQESRYFEPAYAEAAALGQYAVIDELEPRLELAPGVTSRPLLGTNLLASFVRYEPGAIAPPHAHVEEQLFVVLDGEIELQLGSERRVMRMGDAALIPAWVTHSARAVSGAAYQLDVFSPPRQAMLDLISARQSAT